MITRHFLACLSADAQGAETVVRLCIGKPNIPNNPSSSNLVILGPEHGEMFEAKGLMILAPNYLEIYPYDRWMDKDLPVFHLGEWILPSNIEVCNSFWKLSFF